MLFDTCDLKSKMNKKLTLIISLFVVFLRGFLSELPPGNLTDFSVCKVSHLGLGYTGTIAKTESRVRCQTWSMDMPHKIDQKITDDAFPFGSKKFSKNYCRNPDRRVDGPWCYTMNEDLMYETCAVPLCSFSECKITGPGSEYGGNHNRGVSDRKCLKWSKDRSKVMSNGNYTKVKKFSDYLFPDGSANKAKNYCRNPDGDIGRFFF
ncbi:plasminogen-like [Sitophilus oryzae]|uniref:Plasminogen-like n=1 Tax=Sitophilus oryzae TaxID=7048 RepID=A0A6J2X159_SITOR|nr:plasminogen-like [Sitophilus oryzae]